jgi:hypothetical protein
MNRIIRIRRPSAERPLAAGEKNPDNPVHPVLIKIKIESIPHTFIEVSHDLLNPQRFLVMLSLLEFNYINSKLFVIWCLEFFYDAS